MGSNREELRFLLRRARHASLFGAFAMDNDEISRLIDLSGETDDGKLQIDALLFAARIYVNQGSIEEAERLIAQIRDIADAAGDLAALSLARLLRANILVTEGKVEEAHEILDQAVRMSEESGDHRVKAEVMSHLAKTAYDMGNFDDAERSAREARVLSLSTGNRTAKLFATKNLAGIVHHTFRFDEAWRYMEEALSYADNAEFRFVQPGIYEGLGCISASLGFHERSLDYLKTSRLIAAEVGHHRTKVMAAATSIIVLLEMGKLSDAEQELGELKSLIKKHYTDVFNFEIAYSSDAEIWVLLTSGEYDRALELAREVVRKGEESDIFVAKAWGTLGIGNSLFGLRRFEEAFEHLKRAYELAKNNGDSGLIMLSLYSLFKVFKETDREDDARQILIEALNVVKEIATKISDKEYRKVYLEKGYTSRLVVKAAREAGLDAVIDEIMEYTE